jgi:hypothetical protein
LDGLRRRPVLERLEELQLLASAPLAFDDSNCYVTVNGTLNGANLMANDWDPAAERSARPSLPIPPTEPSPLSANAVKHVFSELGNTSRYLPRRGFSAAQPGVAGTPATPGYRATRCGCGRGQRAIDTLGLAETATDEPLNHGSFTAPHGLVICHWLSAAESSRQTGTAHGGLPVAHNKNADSISTIPRGFDFGLGDVG